MLNTEYIYDICIYLLYNNNSCKTKKPRKLCEHFYTQSTYYTHLRKCMMTEIDLSPHRQA